MKVKAALDQFLRKSPRIIARKRHSAGVGASPVSVFDSASHLADGAACDEQLLAVLAGEIEHRLAGAGVTDGPASPQLTDLRVRRAGLPDWWSEGKNLFLAAPGANAIELSQGPLKPPATNAILVMGRDSVVHYLNISGDGAMIGLGDRVNVHGGGIGSVGYSTILIGEGTSATNWVLLDARNGGLILVGADGMWAHNVTMMTDDTHAIRDVATGKRLNGMGGRIVIGRHVWLCANVSVLDGVSIGSDSVVGMGSLLKHATLPSNTVSVGCPAKVIRTGVTWSRDDLP